MPIHSLEGFLSSLIISHEGMTMASKNISGEYRLPIAVISEKSNASLHFLKPWPSWLTVAAFAMNLVGILIAASASAAEPAREYRWKNGAQFAYAFEIETEMEDSIYTIKGTSVYDPQQAASHDKGTMGTGTAFVIHRNGYLITCEHVVHGGKEFTVKLGKAEMSATVLEVDAEHDLALLQVKARDLTALPLGDSRKVALAQQVRIVGYPLSDVLGNDVKVATGNIAGNVDHGGKQLFQLDAAVNPGNSGGPVINDRGEVIGIANAKLAGLEVSNVGFAVPSEEAKQLLARRHITNQATAASKALAGPELANRVTPAVAMVTVKSGAGGIGVGDSFRLSFRGNYDSWKRPKDAPLKDAALLLHKDSVKGRFQVDSHGEVQKTADAVHLPFGLGPLGLVGIERLPDLNQQSWQVQRTFTLSEVLADSPIAFTELLPEPTSGGPGGIPGFGPGFGPGSGPPGRRRVGPMGPFGPPGASGPSRSGGSASADSAPPISVVQEIDYELGSASANGMETFKRKYRLSLPASSGKKAKFSMSGEGTVAFNRKAGVLQSSDFSGKLSYDGEKDSFVIPVKYACRRIDPSASGNVGSLIAKDPKESKKDLPDDDAGKTASETAEAKSEPRVEQRPLPSKDDRQRADASVAEVFGDQIKAARGVPEKIALSDKLLNAATEEPDAALRYALLNRSRLMAIDAGDLDAARLAAEEMMRQYKIDPLKVRVAVVLAIEKKAAIEQNDPVARFAAKLLDDLIAADDYDSADKIYAAAVGTARKGGDVELIKRIDRRGKDLKRIREEFDALKDQRAALQNNADDADANAAVGKFYALAKGDWEKALPMLVRGNDADLKAAAEKDLAAPKRAEDQMPVADLWWKLAENAKGSVQDFLRARALKWYQQAAPQLVGLESAKVEKRLEQYKNLLPSEDEPAEPAPSSVASRRRDSVSIKSETPAPAAQNAPMLSTTKILGHAFGEEVQDLAPEGGVLIGFDVGLGKWMAGNNDIVVAIRPIYRSRSGTEVRGKQYGTDMSRTVQVKAKAGYAVGGVRGKWMGAINGFAVTFMKMQGKSLDQKKSYDSDWIGSKGNGLDAELESNGALVVGIVVHENNKSCTGFGLCVKK